MNSDYIYSFVTEVATDEWW